MKNHFDIISTLPRHKQLKVDTKKRDEPKLHPSSVEQMETFKILIV